MIVGHAARAVGQVEGAGAIAADIGAVGQGKAAALVGLDARSIRQLQATSAVADDARQVGIQQVIAKPASGERLRQALLELRYRRPADDVDD